MNVYEVIYLIWNRLIKSTFQQLLHSTNISYSWLLFINYIYSYRLLSANVFIDMHSHLYSHIIFNWYLCNVTVTHTCFHAFQLPDHIYLCCLISSRFSWTKQLKEFIDPTLYKEQKVLQIWDANTILWWKIRLVSTTIFVHSFIFGVFWHLEKYNLLGLTFGMIVFTSNLPLYLCCVTNNLQVRHSVQYL